MEPFTHVDLQSLEWKQPNVGGRLYELHSAGGVVARLHWRSKPGALTTAEAAGSGWVFKREGYVSSPQVYILSGSIEEGAEAQETGHYRTERGSSGVLHLAGGRDFRWTRSGRWRSGGTFSAANGEPLLHLRWKPSPFKAGAKVEVLDSTPTKLAATDLLLLVIVGWYLMRLKADDDAIAAGAAAAAIAATSV